MKYTNAKHEVKAVQVNNFVKVPSKAGTLAVTAFGFILGGSQLLTFIISLIATLLFDAAFGTSSRIFMGLSSAFSAILSGTGFYLGVQGTKRYQRIERLKSYLSAIGNKEYCNVSELSKKVGKSAKTVVKDLEYMIRKNWLKQGHLDQQKTCLMLTDQMYTQYCQIEQQRAIEQKETKERAEKGNLARPLYIC